MEGIEALQILEKEAERCQQLLMRKRRLELPLPEEDMEEGEVDEERDKGKQRFQQPNLTDLADAVDIASIRTTEQRTVLLKKPSPAKCGLRLWMIDLKEAKALGRIMLLELQTVMQNEEKVKRLEEEVATRRARNHKLHD